MADKLWSKKAFEDGYSSGNIIEVPNDKIRLLEENKIGGSYRSFFIEGVKPLINDHSKVLELGPGKGSWTRAFLSTFNNIEIHTVDLHDIRPWVQDIMNSFPEKLYVHQVDIEDSNYSFLKNNYFDVFFAFGVFCHMNLKDIGLFLNRIKRTLKKGSICIAQYSNWEKAVHYCYREDGYRYNVEPFDMITSDYPFEVQMMKSRTIFSKLNTIFERFIKTKFKKPKIVPEEYWWVRNNKKIMNGILNRSGYKVIEIDMDYFKRDSVALFRPIKNNKF